MTLHRSIRGIISASNSYHRHSPRCPGVQSKLLISIPSASLKGFTSTSHSPALQDLSWRLVSVSQVPNLLGHGMHGAARQVPLRNLIRFDCAGLALGSRPSAKLVTG